MLFGPLFCCTMVGGMPRPAIKQPETMLRRDGVMSAPVNGRMAAFRRHHEGM